jgi:hypothetical protein
MTDRPKVVALNSREMDTLLLEADQAEEDMREAANLTEGATRVSWALINWAKAQMPLRPF